MAQRPHGKAYRLRRTVAPAEGAPAETSPFRRALWGVPEAQARRTLDDQARTHAAELQETDGQVQSARADLERLQQQVDAQKRRLQSLRGVVEVLRDKLAKERAARAVLAARLLDRQADDQRQREAAIARMETARLGADIQQEHEALRQLVAALYRSIAGRGPVPAHLQVLETIPVSKPATGGGPLRPAHAPQWHKFLTGKKAGQTLATPQGHQIVAEGETIGPENIATAEEAGLLFELILTARVVERIPDL
ncbi:MAG TPA: hypothetical protein VK464_14650 [Symbiobacteriaceae bacterium]|nr:hypothetical protein [Symbiobacteriaceae bacterium]